MSEWLSGLITGALLAAVVILAIRSWLIARPVKTGEQYDPEAM